MKILLGLSLALNIFFGYFIYQKEDQTFYASFASSREVIAKPNEKVNIKKPTSENALSPISDASNIDQVSRVDFEPIVTNDEYSFQQANLEMEQAKKDFYIKADVSSESVFKAKQLIEVYWSEYSAISKRRFDWQIPFEDRKKLLELVENLDKELGQTYGEKQWQLYKDFIDNYNQKISETRSRTGADDGGLVFSYY